MAAAARHVTSPFFFNMNKVYITKFIMPKLFHNFSGEYSMNGGWRTCMDVPLCDNWSMDFAVHQWILISHTGRFTQKDDSCLFKIHRRRTVFFVLLGSWQQQTHFRFRGCWMGWKTNVHFFFVLLGSVYPAKASMTLYGSAKQRYSHHW